MRPPVIGERAALLVIDVQRGFDEPGWGRRNNAAAEGVVRRLLAAWRADGRPVAHAQHVSLEPESALRPGQPGVEIKPEAAPRAGEPVFQKSVNSAFIGTGLEDYLRAEGIESLVMVGLTTDHCVSTTARMAANLGFETLVVEDATAAFDRVGPDGVAHPAELVHSVSLASLHGEFATVVSSEELLRMLRANRPQNEG